MMTLTRSVFLVWICDFIEPAVADEPPVGDGEVGALADDGLLDLHDLGHMIAPRPELGLADPLVHAL